MNPEPEEGDFRTETLSVREREILDLSAEGRTDEQISQVLGITISTVNSYWVRIRGKVGQFSRTDLVGRLLRREANRRQEDLVAENARLRTAEGIAQSDLAQSRADLRATDGPTWPLLALSHAADAIVVCLPPSHIVYANLQAQRLFDSRPGELEGLAPWDLAMPDDEDARLEIETGFRGAEIGSRVTLGIETPFYAQRRNGTNFRAVLLAERFASPQGAMAVITIREFMSEAETILRALRQPYPLL